MMLLANRNSRVNLAHIDGVKEVFAANNGGITIHLACNEGDEQKVSENLPKWVHEEFTVVKSHEHVFLKAKV